MTGIAPTSPGLASDMAPAAGADPQPRPEPGLVVVVDVDGRLLAAVSQLLGEEPGVEVLGCSDPRGIGTILEERDVTVLVAGPGMDDDAGIARLEIIRDELPGIGIIAVTDPAGPRATEARRIGVDDLVSTSAEPQALIDSIGLVRTVADGRREADGGRRARPDAATPRGPSGSTSRVFAVTSASGGAGKSFLATNLAWFLHSEGGRKVLLIDLDLGFGDLAAALRLEPSPLISDLLQPGADLPSAVDRAIGGAVRHGSGLHVLASPADPPMAGLLTSAIAGQLIDSATTAFDDIVLDVPALAGAGTSAVLRRANGLHVLATLDIPSLRNLRILMEHLRSIGIADDVLRLIINKVQPGVGLDPAQVARLLPIRMEAELPLGGEVVESFNTGTPVLAMAPRSEVGRALADALLPLIPAGDRAGGVPSQDPRNGPGWLGKIRGGRR